MMEEETRVKYPYRVQVLLTRDAGLTVERLAAHQDRSRAAVLRKAVRIGLATMVGDEPEPEETP